nr:SAM-dependent methyltransferase [Lachnospiraceae bacterium]
YELFAQQVKNIKIETHNLLGELKKKGAKIAAFGAAAKGNTFLNYCGIGKEYIDFVADSSTAKQNLYLPGTRIPIVAPEKIRETRPDYIIILPWNLKKEIVDILAYTREWGCKFITFIPEVEVF